MVYILTIKKHFAQKGTHPSLVVVRNYINHYGQDDLLICWPGYLSTNTRTAKTFHRRFPLMLSKGCGVQTNPCFFFDGNNGKRNMSGSLPITTISKYINSLYNGFSSSYCPNDDHSKIIAFCDVHVHTHLSKGSTIDNYIDDIVNKKIKIKALLIGSSNQSHYTMTKVPPDKKGECDVFLFDGDFCRGEEGAINLYNSLLENQDVDKTNDGNSIVLSKEICSTSSLNDIFASLIL